ncbi:MAG TPA: hypothetical protein VFQ00_02160 [Terriglobales bacterium]|nr:hypothetical protein [Terriglobales bacterium]
MAKATANNKAAKLLSPEAAELNVNTKGNINTRPRAAGSTLLASGLRPTSPAATAAGTAKQSFFS